MTGKYGVSVYMSCRTPDVCYRIRRYSSQTYARLISSSIDEPGFGPSTLGHSSLPAVLPVQSAEMDRRSQSKTFPVIGQTSFLELHRISRRGLLLSTAIIIICSSTSFHSVDN